MPLFSNRNEFLDTLDKCSSDIQYVEKSYYIAKLISEYKKQDKSARKEFVLSEKMINELSDKAMSVDRKWNKLRAYLSEPGNVYTNLYEIFMKVINKPRIEHGRIYHRINAFKQEIRLATDNPRFENNKCMQIPEQGLATLIGAGHGIFSSITRSPISPIAVKALYHQLTMLQNEDDNVKSDFIQLVIDNYQPKNQSRYSYDLLGNLKSINSSFDRKINTICKYILERDVNNCYTNNGKRLFNVINKIFDDMSKLRSQIPLSVS